MRLATELTAGPGKYICLHKKSLETYLMHLLPLGIKSTTMTPLMPQNTVAIIFPAER